MRDDIFKCPVLLAEPTGDYAQLNKAEFPIQRKSAFVCPDNGIELQNAEPAFFSLHNGMANKRFPDVTPSPFRSNGITGVADMSATSNIVRMQNIESGNLSGFFVPGKPRERLHGKESMTGFRIKLVLLGEGNAIANNLVPNREASLNMFGRIGYYQKAHLKISLRSLSSNSLRHSFSRFVCLSHVLRPMLFLRDEPLFLGILHFSAQSRYFSAFRWNTFS